MSLETDILNYSQAGNEFGLQPPVRYILSQAEHFLFLDHAIYRSGSCGIIEQLQCYHEIPRLAARSFE